MRPFLCALVVLYLSAMAIAARPTFKFSSSVLQLNGQSVADYSVVLAAKNNIMVYFDPSDGNVVVVRRNNEGLYLRDTTVFNDGAGPYVQTNGRIIMTSGDIPKAVFTKLGDNGQSTDPSEIFSAGGQLLSDDTFVGMDPTPNNDNTYTIHTWEYQPDYNNWTLIEDADLKVTTESLYAGYVSTYRASNTHLVVNDYTSNKTYAQISIYERQPNKSWKLIDSFAANSSVPSPFAGSVTYNGIDTVVISYPFSISDGSSISNKTNYGVVQIFTKTNNGAWIQQDFNPVSLGYRPAGLLGTAILFLDANTLLISAALEGYDINRPSSDLPTAGKVLMLTRDASTGRWNDTMDLIGNNGLFGLGLTADDTNVLVVQVNSAGSFLGMSVLAAPLCFYKPINVTCYDQQLNDCNKIDTSSLYAVNNPECGQVDATLDSINFDTGANAIKAQLTFTRPLVDNSIPVTCTATITCPAPPGTLGPVVISPNGRTSSAFATQFSVINLILMMILSLLQQVKS